MSDPHIAGYVSMTELFNLHKSSTGPRQTTCSGGDEEFYDTLPSMCCLPNQQLSHQLSQAPGLATESDDRNGVKC